MTLKMRFVMGALVVSLLPASVAYAEGIQARYMLRYLDMNLGEITIADRVVGSRYQALLDARVVGLAAMASSFSTKMSANGQVRKGTLSPDSFVATEASGGGVTHKSQMLFQAGDVKTVSISPPFETARDVVPITEWHRHDVVDPSSAFVMSVPDGQTNVGPAACDRKIRIFNGVVRFDLAFAFVRTANESGAAGYRGPVSICSVRFTPIAGYPRSDSMIQFLTENRKIEARLAPVAASHSVVLVGLFIPMQVGTARIDLQSLSVDPIIPSDR